jgi:AraC-like DNA-binding protein
MIINNDSLSPNQKANIHQEITPITNEDFLILLNHRNADFNYPIHFHPEFELNLVLNSSGKRIVADSIEDFSSCDLVLIGSNIPHAWRGDIIEGNHVITIQFHNYLIESEILSKKSFLPIKQLLEKSSKGIVFHINQSDEICKSIVDLGSLTGIDVPLKLFHILHYLSINTKYHVLASNAYDSDKVINESKSRRIAKILNYIDNHYMHDINLQDIAEEINMSSSALGHFFKKRTNKTIIEYINGVRIGHACRLLYETTYSINEIAYLCGYNNISNFNRTFKRIKLFTPNEYRENAKNIMTIY